MVFLRGMSTTQGVSSPYHETKLQGRVLLVQEAEQAEKRLDVDLEVAQVMEEASRPLDVDLATALAGPRLIWQKRI